MNDTTTIAPSGDAAAAPQSGIDLSQLENIPLKNTISIVNSYIVNSLDFINRIAYRSEKDQLGIEHLLESIDTKLLLLESKLNSVNPEFYSQLPQTTPPQLTPYPIVAAPDNNSQSAQPQQQSQDPNQISSAPGLVVNSGAPPPPPGLVVNSGAPPPPPGLVFNSGAPPPPPGLVFNSGAPPPPPGLVFNSGAPPPPPGLVFNSGAPPPPPMMPGLVVNSGAPQPPPMMPGLVSNPGAPVPPPFSGGESEQKSEQQIVSELIGDVPPPPVEEELDENMRKYVKMAKLKIPIQAIKLKMQAEGYDPALLDQHLPKD